MGATSAKVMSLLLLIGFMVFPVLSARAEDQEDEQKAWSGSVSLSGGHSSGTKNAFNGRLEAGVQRDWKKDRVRLNLDALYGKSDGDIDTDSQRAFGDYRHNFSRRLFGLWNVEVGRDQVENVKVRAFTTLGPGYRIWEQDAKSYLDAEVGVGFRHESFLVDPETTEKTEARNNPSLRAKYEYKDVVGPKQVLQLSHSTELLLPLTDVETFLVRSRVGVAVPLILELKLNLSFNVEYQNDPAAGAEKWNTKSTFGVLYEF